jgi:ribosome-associated toxin RatA of RatAB toxin-antitoxin module
MPVVEARTDIAAPVQQVYEIAKNVAEFPEFMPDVQSVTILSQEGNRLVTEWAAIVRQFGRTMRWQEEDEWDDRQRLCTFKLVKGDWTKYEGTWKFDESPGGTSVSLRLDYEMNVPLLGALIKAVIDKLVRHNVDQMLEGLRRRAVSAGAGGS